MILGAPITLLALHTHRAIKRRTTCRLLGHNPDWLTAIATGHKHPRCTRCNREL